MANPVDEIVGGIEALGSSAVETIISGGNPTIVGHNALDAMRDRAIYLNDDLDGFDTKKLLGIIGMSQPIAFGMVSFDDGETSFIISSKKLRTTPSDELMKDLATRLTMPPEKIADWLVHFLNLEKPIWLALGEFTDTIIRQMDLSLIARGKKPLDTIRILPDIACLIPFTTRGKLEVSPDADSNTKSFKSFATYLLDLCVTKKCIEPRAIPAKEKLVAPEFPRIDESVIRSMNETSDEQKTVSDYVRAIIMRENKLTPYLVAVERYNVMVAQGIQEYTVRLLEYFPKSPETK
jgi:hypothetical protein